MNERMHAAAAAEPMGVRTQCCDWVAPTQRMPYSARCGEGDSQLNVNAAVSAPGQIVLRIAMNHGSAGFFAYMLYVINQLLFARRNSMTAVVEFPECTINGHDHYASGGRNLYFDSKHGSNMWDYYFEPVGRIPKPTARVITLSSRMLWRLHHESKASVYAYYYGRHASKRAEGYDDEWYKKMRLRAHGVLSRHVRLKPHVQTALDEFWRRELAWRRPVLGLHIRGTDKLVSVGGAVVPPSSYIWHVDQYIGKHPNATLFIATDSPESLSFFRRHYALRVVARPALRSNKNAFLDDTMTDRYAKGLDVLLDAMLLSRCDYLLKSSSAVGEFAIYFNPKLHANSRDLQFDGGRGNSVLPSPVRPKPAALEIASHNDKNAQQPCAMNMDVMLQSLDFLPASMPFVPRPCPQVSASSRTSLFAELSRLQGHGRLCSKKQSAQVTSTNLLPAGWFSTLHGIIKPLVFSMRTDAILLTPAIPAFTPESCPWRDLSCFFERIEGSACNLHGEARLLDLRDDAFVRNESFVLRGGSVIPRLFRERGWFWFSSQLLSWVMRPHAALAADLSVALHTTGLGAALERREPVLGIHVRHGDACMRRERRRMARSCHSLAAHLHRVRDYAKATGVRTIYLATDSELVLEQARRSTEFEFLWLPNVSRHRRMPKQIMDKVVAARVRDGLTEESYRDAWLATLDVMLLAKCHILVGQMTSTLFRTAISLRAAACDCTMPFASLDAPFCSDYGVRSGRIGSGGQSNQFWC